jgi:hypothetical protein
MFGFQREPSFKRALSGHLTQVVIAQGIGATIEQLGQFIEGEELVAAKLQDNPPNRFRTRSFGYVHWFRHVA